MPRCYLLCLCERSLLDATSNNLTLISVVEELRLSKPPPQQRVIELPLEVHAYWVFSVDELGRPFEFRLIAKEHGLPDMASEPMQVKETVSRRFRARFVDPQIRAETASLEFHLQWRWIDETEWRTEQAFWPLEVTMVEAPEPAPANAHH